MNKFEKICKQLQRNFDSHPVTTMCMWRPRTPAFTRPHGTKYLAFLKAASNGPIHCNSISKSTQQNLRWSGLCESTKDGYVLTELGREYLKLANKR